MTQSEEVRHSELLLQSQSMDNRFSFRRDYVTSKVLTKLEALFIQDLINRATMKNAHKRIVEEADGSRPYCLCTVEFLERSLDWDRNIQQRLFQSLRDKGFVRVHYTGVPPRRFVWINIIKLEEAVRDAASQGTSFDVPQESSNDVPQRTSNDVPSYTCKNKKQDIKNNAGTPKAAGNACENHFLQKARSQGQQLAEGLYGLLLQNRKIREKDYNCRSWTTCFNQAIQDYSFAEVQTALDKYKTHFGHQYMTKVYAANTFCRNIPRILDLAENIERKQFAGKHRLSDDDIID